MSESAQGRILSEQELIELSEQLRRDTPNLWPIDMLNSLSAKFLAARFPVHAEAIQSGKHAKTAGLFSYDTLRANDIAASQWTSEERQKELYGGIEPLLFSKLPDGILEFYGKKLDAAAKKLNPVTGVDTHDDEEFDPLTCEATEIG